MRTTRIVRRRQAGTQLLCLALLAACGGGASGGGDVPVPASSADVSSTATEDTATAGEPRIQVFPPSVVLHAHANHPAVASVVVTSEGDDPLTVTGIELSQPPNRLSVDWDGELPIDLYHEVLESPWCDEYQEAPGEDDGVETATLRLTLGTAAGNEDREIPILL